MSRIFTPQGVRICALHHYQMFTALPRAVYYILCTGRRWRQPVLAVSSILAQPRTKGSEQTHDAVGGYVVLMLKQAKAAAVQIGAVKVDAGDCRYFR